MGPSDRCPDLLADRWGLAARQAPTKPTPGRPPKGFKRSPTLHPGACTLSLSGSAERHSVGGETPARLTPHVFQSRLTSSRRYPRRSDQNLFLAIERDAVLAFLRLLRRSRIRTLGTPHHETRSGRAANRAGGDEPTPLHAACQFYDVEGFRSGRDDRPGQDQREPGSEPANSARSLKISTRSPGR
jgi:hypothetical protein